MERPRRRSSPAALRARRGGTVARIRCASPDYLLARGTPETPGALAGHHCIAAASATPATRWSFRAGEQGRHVAACSVEVRPKLTVSTAEAAVDAASAGLGITRVYSYQAAAAISEGRLIRVLERFEPVAVPVHVIHGEGRGPRSKVRAFVQLAAARLRDRLDPRAWRRDPLASSRVGRAIG
jgi:DNA-binding transcriptional LysR family regulator